MFDRSLRQALRFNSIDASFETSLSESDSDDDTAGNLSSSGKSFSTRFLSDR